jgi:Invasion associated locus B (IalB) protein
MNSPIVRVLGAVALGLAATAAMAQESTNRVATMTDWNVFTEANPKECWGVSKPKESVNVRDGQPVSVRRGDILLFVTFRPGKAPEVSFTGGYPFASGSTVDVSIGGATYQLFTEGEWAWTGSPDDDAKLLAEMKKGESASLKARSGKGTETTDTFSLLGFSAAIDDAAKRCQ